MQFLKNKVIIILLGVALMLHCLLKSREISIPEHNSADSVIITGAGKGLGRELVDLFHNRTEYTIIALCFDECASLDHFSRERVKSHKIDLRDTSSTKILAHKIFSLHRRISFLINNAGLTDMEFFEDSDSSLGKCFDVLDVNLKASMLLSRLYVEYAKENRRSSVVNIASVVSHGSGIMNSCYIASKHALFG